MERPPRRLSAGAPIRHHCQPAPRNNVGPDCALQQPLSRHRHRQGLRWLRGHGHGATHEVLQLAYHRHGQQLLHFQQRNLQLRHAFRQFRSHHLRLEQHAQQLSLRQRGHCGAAECRGHAHVPLRRIGQHELLARMVGSLRYRYRNRQLVSRISHCGKGSKKQLQVFPFSHRLGESELYQCTMDLHVEGRFGQRPSHTV